MALVFGVLDGLDEFEIAEGAAAILGRTVTADLDQAWIALAWLRIDETLDLDRVLPGVAEVIEVDSSLCRPLLTKVGRFGRI